MKFKEPAGSIIDKVIYGSIGLAVLFLMLTTIVLPYLNSTLAFTVVGLPSGLVVGIISLVFFLALIGFALVYIPRKK